MYVLYAFNVCLSDKKNLKKRVRPVTETRGGGVVGGRAETRDETRANNVARESRAQNDSGQRRVNDTFDKNLNVFFLSLSLYLDTIVFPKGKETRFKIYKSFFLLSNKKTKKKTSGRRSFPHR